jgi:hypothetical protein
VSANRYYQLEQRALEGMLLALEPRPRGPRVRPEAELERLKREVSRWQREATRTQALLRTTQRALGMKEGRKEDAKEKPGRGRARRPRVRARAVIKALEAGDAAPAEATVVAEGGG